MPPASEPYGVAVGDFNGDGKLDIAVTSMCQQQCHHPARQGRWDLHHRQPLHRPPERSPNGIVVGDFNGDGKLDLAVANEDSNTITILLGNGDGTFSRLQRLRPAWRLRVGIVAGDFNGDGKLDLAVTISAAKRVTILLGNGDGTFTPAAASPGNREDPDGHRGGDWNGDGKLDLAVANYSSQM